MANKIINGRIVLKHDVAQNWELATGFTPMAGEIIIYDIDENNAEERIKIGDGVRNVNELPFVDDVLRSELMSQINEAINNYNPNWNAAVGESGHILNRTHYAKEIETVWLEETSFEFTPDNYYGVDFQDKIIEIGKTYRVTYNGESYTCVSKTIKASGTAYVVFGNLVDFNGEDTGEPFVVMHIPAFGISAVVLAAPPSTNETIAATVGIVKVEEEIHKINPKYLPKGVGYEEYNTNTLTKDFRISPLEGTTYVNVQWINFDMIEDIYSITVVFDGETYECPIGYEQGEDRYVLGSLNNDTSDYPFWISAYRNNYRGAIGGNDGGSHTVSVYAIYETVYKIAPKYLPDGIGYMEMSVEFPKTTLELWSENYGEFMLENFIPVIGKKYEIRWGDLVYTCIAEHVVDGGMEGIGLGDLSIFSGSDNNEPFLIIWEGEPNTSSIFVDLSGMSTTATIEIKGENVRKIPEKYLPYSLPKCTTITMLAENWTGDSNPWSQVVTMNGVTINSKIDLQPTAVQVVELQNNDIAFMVENDNGVVTVYALGGKPTVDYTMQALITEVAVV